MKNNRPVYTEHSRSAGFWSRSLASLIDTAIFLLVFLFIVYKILSSSHSLSDLATIFVTSLALVILPLSIYNIFHRSIFTHLFGGTPGKLITGLAVTATDGSKLPFKKILFRQIIGYQLSTVAFGLGFMSILKDPENRAWHDKAVGSKVITRAMLWPVGLLALAALLYGNYLVGKMAVNSFQTNTLLKTDAAVLFSQYTQEKKKDTQEPKQYNLQLNKDTLYGSSPSDSTGY